MSIHIIIIILIIIIFTLFIIYSTIYNKFQDYIIKINEVEGKIDDAIREKFDIILKLNNIIKEKIKTNKTLVDDLTKIKNVSSFEMDRKLIDAMNKVNFVKSKYDKIETDEEVIKLTYDIEDIDESLRAFKKFYNETITDYNRLIRIFPYNIVGYILKYKEKTFFDGKDMNDDNIKDFKL
ncbi:MAG: LemA family protein [Bacilli bacterium]|nr:LemA family protein [Bacilli bacterium]MBP3635585.1 LemA family protein [Bacilli bacterium]